MLLDLSSAWLRDETTDVDTSVELEEERETLVELDSAVGPTTLELKEITP